jgi:hypothetical protein
MCDRSGRKDRWRDRRRGRGVPDRERSLALQAVLDVQTQLPLARPKPSRRTEEHVTDRVRRRRPKEWVAGDILAIAIPGRCPCRVTIQVPDQECGMHSRRIKRERIRDGTELIIHVARPQLEWAKTCVFDGCHSRGNRRQQRGRQVRGRYPRS